ncbi:MAG: hypothetical protein PHQ04_00240 [Opitutaceae bacterium]|nr:hypothetical protein [Opitutaceae bacterium]
MTSTDRSRLACAWEAGEQLAGSSTDQVVTIGHCRQASEGIPQAGKRAPPVAAAADNHQVEDGGALPGMGMSMKSRFFAPGLLGPMAFSTELVSSTWSD